MFNCTTAAHESPLGLSNPRGESLREKNELQDGLSAAVQPAGGDDIIPFLIVRPEDLEELKGFVPASSFSCSRFSGLIRVVTHPAFKRRS